MAKKKSAKGKGTRAILEETITGLRASVGTTVPFPHSGSSTAGYFLSSKDKKRQAGSSFGHRLSSSAASGILVPCPGIEPESPLPRKADS